MKHFPNVDRGHLNCIENICLLSGIQFIFLYFVCLWIYKSINRKPRLNLRYEWMKKEKQSFEWICVFSTVISTRFDWYIFSVHFHLLKSELFLIFYSQTFSKRRSLFFITLYRHCNTFIYLFIYFLKGAYSRQYKEERNIEY